MNSKAFIPRDYDVFAGLDVDKKSISVTFTNQQGFIRSLRVPYSAEHLVNHVRKHFPDQKVAFAYEAGPTGYGLYDGIVAQDYPCLIASPSMIPKAPGQKSEDQSARQSRHFGESWWRTAQEHSCPRCPVP